MRETPLEKAERHVREGEVLIARQREIVFDLEQGGYSGLAKRGRQLLSGLESNLKMAQERVQRERRQQTTQ